MTLQDLLFYTSEYTNVVVKSFIAEQEIARYDGKDSIPNELNELFVSKIEVEDNKLVISILDPIEPIKE